MSDNTSVRMAENFITKYGRDEFMELISAFQAKIVLRIIGERYGVSKQRVSDWKIAFGTPVYEVHPEVFEYVTSKLRS